MSDFLKDVADSMIDYIEYQARSKGGLRGIHADFLSENGYRNREFEDLLNIYAREYDNLANSIDPNGRKSDQQIFETTIPNLLDGHLAYMVIGDRKLSDRLDDRTYEDMQHLAAEWEREWCHGGRSSSRGRDRDRDYRSQDRNRDYQGRSSSRTGGGNYFTADEIGATVPSNRRNSSSGGGSAIARGIGASVTEEFKEEPPRRVREPLYREPVEVIEEKAPVVRTTGANEGPDFTKAFPHADFWQDGENWIFLPMAKQDDTDRLQLSFFDVNKELSFLVKNNKSLRQENIQVNDNNRYAQHELMNNPARALQNDSPIVSLSGKNQPAKEEEDTDSSPTPLYDVLGNKDFIRMLEESSNNTKLVSDLKEGGDTAMLELSKVNKLANPSFFVVRDIVISNTDGDFSQMLKYLDNAHSLADFHKRLTEVKSTLDRNIWEKVNRRMSRFIENSLRFQWRLPPKTSFDFFTQFPAFLDAFTKRSNQDMVSAFHLRTKPLVTLAMARLDDSDISEYLADLVEAKQIKNTVVFVDNEVIVAVRKTADALGIGNQLKDRRTGVTVRQLENSDLQSAIRAIYRTLPYGNETLNNMRNVHILTSDYILVTVYTFNGRPEEFVLSQPVDGL